MKTECRFLKKTGKIFLTVIILIFTVNLLAIEVSTEVDANIIGINESIIFQIKVSDAGKVEAVSLPEIKGLGFGYAGITRSRQWVNGNYWAGFILQYRVTGLQEGKYVIPPVKFLADGKEYSSDSFQIEVSADVKKRPKSVFDQLFAEDDNLSSRRTATQVKFEAVAEKKEIFLGQPVAVRLYLVTNSPESLKISSIENDTDESKFYVKSVTEKIEDTRFNSNGEIFYRKHIQTYIYIPLAHGNFLISGGKAQYYVQEGFSVVQKNEKFEGKKLEVKTLPGIVSGNVYTGVYNLEFDKNKIKKTDNEASFEMKLSGKGNFVMPIEWIVEKPSSFEVLSSVNDADLKIEGNDIAGSYTYAFTVIPGEENECAINNIYINTFNPETKSFIRLETGAINLKFSKEPNAEDSTETTNSINSGNGKILAVIIGSSVMIFLSAAVFVVFLIYERKKSSIENLTNERKTSELKKRVSEKLSGEAAVLNGNECIVELKKALRNSDRNKIVSVIERSIAYLKQKGFDSNELDQIQDLLSRSKFGGAGLSNETLSRIITDVVEMIKEIK